MDDALTAEQAVPALITGARCRFCGGALHGFLDLGMSPLCESFVAAERLNEMEQFYPLSVFVCTDCFLVQLQEYVSPAEIFSEYAYFSSYSDSYVAHGREFAHRAAARFGLGARSFVVELASNDGYLLQHFVQLGIPALGVEPAANVARAAAARGVRTRVAFFGEQIAREILTAEQPADLVIANNVLAQVPDLNAFVSAMAMILAVEGVATIEVPHLMRLIAGDQFDTIYHEHFSYFSLAVAQRILAAHGLRLFDVEEIWTHGGSLRLYACRAGAGHADRPAVAALMAQEAAAGLQRLETYAAFAGRVEECKRGLLSFLIAAKRQGRRIAAYGAPGKGNTLLNYCGIRRDFLDYAVDRNPYKHGKFLPGTHVPILPVETIARTRPDYLLILPWNLQDEIMKVMSFIGDWGGRFVVPIPAVRVFPDL